MEEKKNFCKEFENKYNVKIEINEINIKLIFENGFKKYKKIVKTFIQDYEKAFNILLKEHKIFKQISESIKISKIIIELIEDKGDKVPAIIKEPKPNLNDRALAACKKVQNTQKTSKKANNNNNKK